jgi:zinc transport system substrate-binding protein
VKSKPFVVFHDAYQYFQRRFGLSIAGTITVSPESMPGADRISEVREKLKTLGTACVFAEPQFDPRIVDVLIEGTSAGKGTLDPEGADLPEGPGLYAALLTALADSIVGCLAK